MKTLATGLGLFLGTLIFIWFPIFMAFCDYFELHKTAGIYIVASILVTYRFIRRNEYADDPITGLVLAAIFGTIGHGLVILGLMAELSGYHPRGAQNEN